MKFFSRLCVLLVAVPSLLAAQQKPHFTDVTTATEIKLNTKPRPGQPQYGEQKVHGVAVEDFDGDGKLDILVVCFGEPFVQLFRKLGDFRFQDVTKGSGLESFVGWGTGAAVGDYDRDGKLDVFLTSLEFNREDNSQAADGKHSRLYQGLGGGKFRDVTKESGTKLKVPGRSCAWSDIDADGWLDLFVTCPYANSVLFRNNRDGTFTDVAEQAGVALPDQMSLGCAFGDIDGDGLDDLFVTNYWRNFHPTRNLHQVNRAVAEIVNNAAKHDLAQLSRYAQLDDDSRKKHIERILLWCRENAAKSR